MPGTGITNPSGLQLVAYGGANCVLIAFSVPDNQTKGLAGFAIWRRRDGDAEQPLLNRLNFDDPITSATTPAQRKWTSSETLLSRHSAGSTYLRTGSVNRRAIESGPCFFPVVASPCIRAPKPASRSRPSTGAIRSSTPPSRAAISPRRPTRIDSTTLPSGLRAIRHRILIPSRTSHNTNGSAPGLAKPFSTSSTTAVRTRAARSTFLRTTSMNRTLLPRYVKSARKSDCGLCSIMHRYTPAKRPRYSRPN